MRRAEPHPFHVTVTRYLDRRGRQCKKNTPGARKVTTETETYYAALPRPGGGRPEVVSLGTVVESEAWEVLRQKLQERAQEAERARDPARFHAKKTLVEHAEDWLAVVAAEGAGPKHLGQLRHNVLRVAEVAGWERLADIDRDSLAVALGKIQAGKGGIQGDQPVSACTRNRHLLHVRQFVQWAHDGGRMAQNPTRKVRILDAEADRRRIRREPTTEEVEQLFAYLALPDCPAQAGESGPKRALAYQLVMATGIRGKELATLDEARIDLERAKVQVLASHTKNGKLAEQPLPAWLVERLAEWRARSGRLSWRWPVRPGAALRADLEAAGIAYRLPGPEPLYFDFHALRVWYISTLAAQPDMDIKTLMGLARHSQPTLTLKVYARVRAKSQKAAVAGLPRLPALPTPPADPAVAAQLPAGFSCVESGGASCAISCVEGGTGADTAVQARTAEEAQDRVA